MKKKIFLTLMLLVGVFTLSACTGGKVDLNDYLIEERNNLFVAEGTLYSATYSSGRRETNYALDGVRNEMVDFGIITFARNDNSPMTNDTYTYVLTINDEEHTGFLEKSPIDNTYSVDVGVAVANDAVLNIKISFTGYTFTGDLIGVSKDFNVDKAGAIKLANENLADELKNITADKNNSIEAVMKIVKDYSTSENKRYYWYVGVVSTNGDVAGILIDANSGEIVATKA